MKKSNSLGTYFQLSDELQLFKYRGCGHGQVIVDKKIDDVIDMDYLDEDGDVIDEQNISMCADAGTVLAENDTTITYKANFSCGQACLF